MIGYPITYGDNLTQEQANKSLKEVQIGAMLVISVYLLLNKAANAADGNTSPSGIPQTPNNTAVCPATPTNTNAGKEILAGIAATISSTGANTGNFWIGVTCGLVVLAGMRMALNK